MGRTARGVRGIRLEENDFVVGAAVVEEEKELVTITENGYGKLTPFTEYNTHSRGGKGVTCHAITEKTGRLAGIAGVGEGDDLMLITNEGTIIRTPAGDLRRCGRASQGVIVMRLAEGARLVNFAVVPPEEEDITDSEGESVDGGAPQATESGENTETVEESGQEENLPDSDLEMLDIDGDEA